MAAIVAILLGGLLAIGVAPANAENDSSNSDAKLIAAFE